MSKHSVDPIACLNHDEVCICMTPEKHSSLPKWFECPKEYPCFCLNCKKYRAFEIAWEALEQIGADVPHVPETANWMEKRAKKVLRRIEELGKESK